MTAVPVQTAGDTFGAGNPKTLFDARIYTADGTGAHKLVELEPIYPDQGQRHPNLKDDPAVIVVLNWFGEPKASSSPSPKTPVTLFSTF